MSWHLFYGKLALSKHPRQKLKKRFKDFKENLKTIEIVSKTGRGRAGFDGCNCFEVKKIDHLKLKKAVRESDVEHIPEDIQSEAVYNIY